MTVITRPGMTLEEFLVWDAGQEGKWEFDGSGPVEMTGGTRAHALIQRRILSVLDRLLEGSPFEVFGSELKIQVDGRIRYPEAFVTMAGGPASSRVVHDPIVVFEVVSPSTERTDRLVKPREYGATPSIRRYVLLEQDAVRGTMFVRAGAEWVEQPLRAVLNMPEIAVAVPLAEFYKGLFPAV